MDWKVVKEIRLLITSLPERIQIALIATLLVWLMLVTVMIFMFISKINPADLIAWIQPKAQVSGHIIQPSPAQTPQPAP